MILTDMESQNRNICRKQEKDDDEYSSLICSDFNREVVADILNSSEEIILPSPLKNFVSTPLHSKVLTEIDTNCSSSSISDESDKEFDTLLSRITPFKKVHTGLLNSTLHHSDGRKNTKEIIPVKSWTVERSIRSMRISSSPKQHITPIIFNLNDSVQKDKAYKDPKSLILTINHLEDKTSYEKDNLHVCSSAKSRMCMSNLQIGLSLNKDKPKCSFLESLSCKIPLHCAHADAIIYRKSFKKHKNELVKVLFQQYNARIFNNKLPETMNITWNPRMTKTAGRCTYKKSQNIRTATIELSTKILDCAERVRDTLIHELCHAASWIIHGHQDGHGATWKYWTGRANNFFPELPFVSRCHNYDIVTKYIYKCTGCGGCIGRHSKSLNTKRKICGRCGANFQLLTNGNPSSLIRNPKPLSGFAVYVKENYQNVKKTYHGIQHAEIMKKLSLQFSMLHVTKK